MAYTKFFETTKDWPTSNGDKLFNNFIPKSELSIIKSLFSFDNIELLLKPLSKKQSFKIDEIGKILMLYF